MLIDYFFSKEMLRLELIQAKEEGKDTSGIEENLDGEKALAALDELQKRTLKPDYPYVEPDSLFPLWLHNPHSPNL